MGRMQYFVPFKENPCTPNCSERHVGCHAECERYLTARAKRIEKTETIKKKRAEEAIVSDFEIIEVSKNTGKKRRQI